MLGSRWDNGSQIAGGFSGDGGSAQDDSIKASLDLAHTDLNTIIADTSIIDITALRITTKIVNNWTAAAKDLFDISGGPIRVISIIGTVIAQLRAVTMNLSIVAAVTTPSGNIDIASLLDCNADDIGTLYTLNATFGSALVETTSSIAANLASDFVMPMGTINMTSGAIENTGGTIEWDMLYQKLRTSSSVVPAS